MEIDEKACSKVAFAGFASAVSFLCTTAYASEIQALFFPYSTAL